MRTQTNLDFLQAREIQNSQHLPQLQALLLSFVSPHPNYFGRSYGMQALQTRVLTNADL
jgi:hypothetical protein